MLILVKEREESSLSYFFTLLRQFASIALKTKVSIKLSNLENLKPKRESSF